MGKVILNTDIGGDIDDAIALAMLMNSDDELSVVTVGSDPRLKAKFAKKLIDIAGKNIQVFYEKDNRKDSKKKPCERDCSPLSSSYICERDYSFLTNRDIKKTDKEIGIQSGAVDFMINYTKANNGEVIIISIGPNTNIGQAMDRDKDFASRVKAFYIMGGCVTKDEDNNWKVPEYNLRKDVQSFRKIVESGVETRIVGKDCIMERNSRFEMSTKDMESIGTSAINTAIKKLFERYMEFFEKELKVLPDPLAVGAYLFPTHYTFKMVSIYLTEKGQMYGTPTEASQVYGCVGFDKDKIKKELGDILRKS